MRKILITVGRQFGSGGAEIAHKLSEKIGIAYYDKKLLELAAEKSGLDIDALKRCDEATTNSLLYSLSIGAFITDNGYAPLTGIPLDEKLYLLQRELIIDSAKQGGAIFVGRCSDYILRDDFDIFSVFVHAPLDKRIERIAETRKLSPTEAKKLISRADKRRANHYNFHTDMVWGDMNNYHLCIDSTFAGIDGTVDILAAAAERYFAG